MGKKRRSKKVKSIEYVNKKSPEQIIKKVAVSKEKVFSDPELKLELSELEKLRTKKTYPEEDSSNDSKKGTTHHKTNDKNPTWFYVGSIFAAYLFTVYISIFAALHFENIEFMNITIIFLFVSMILFFLISSLYFISEKNKRNYFVSILFLIGIVATLFYTFKAMNTSNLLRYSISYTIIVAAVSIYFLSNRSNTKI